MKLFNESQSRPMTFSQGIQADLSTSVQAVQPDLLTESPGIATLPESSQRIQEAVGGARPDDKDEAMADEEDELMADDDESKEPDNGKSEPLAPIHSPPSAIEQHTQASPAEPLRSSQEWFEKYIKMPQSPEAN